MSCSIQQRVIDNMVGKDLMEYNESRRLYELTAPAYEFNQEAARIQNTLESTYGIQTEPVIYLHGSETKALRGHSYLRDNMVRNTLVRFRGSELERFQELADVSPENAEEEIQARIEEAETNISASAKSVMEQLGLSLKVMENLKDSEGNPLEGVAAADLLNKAVLITLGNESEITEELAHFYVNALKDTNSPLYSSMRNRVTKTPEYTEVVEKYGGLETYDQEALIDEAIAKIITNRVGEDAVEDRDSRWWQRAWKALKEVFNLEDPYKKAAYNLFNSNLSEYKDAVNSTTNTTIFRSLEAGKPAELVEEELVKTHNRLRINPKLTRDMVKGKMKNVELFEDDQGLIARYMYTEDDGSKRVVSRRVTDPSTIKFMRSMGGIDAVKVAQKREKPKFAAESGTNLHTLGQVLIESEGKKMKGAQVVKLDDNPIVSIKEAQNAAGLNDSMLKEYKEETSRLLNGAREIQKEIDPDKDFKIFTEVRVYDKATDTGGSIDILFLFSDGSAAVYDFKFISPREKFTTGKAGSKQIAIDPFRGGRKESYDSQLSMYSKTLRDNYGITNIRRSRIIPGHMDFSWDKSTGKPTGINTFNIGAKKNRFLQHISVASEYTDDVKINSKLSELYNRLTELNIKKPSAKVRREKDIIYAAIQSFVVESNFSNLIKELNDTVNKVQENVDNRDPDSEGFITFEELHHSLEVLTMFSNVEEIMEDKKDTLKTKEAKEKLEKDLIVLDRLVRGSVNKIQNELVFRTQESSRLDTTVLAPKVGYLSKFTVMDQIDNPIFKETKRRINITHDIIARRTEELRLKWEDLNDTLKVWAKNNSRSLTETYEMFIRDTGEELKLIPMFKKEFWGEVEERVSPDKEGRDANADIEWMKKHFQVKEGAKKSYDALLKKRIAQLKLEYPDQGRAYDAELQSFKDRYNVFGGNPKAWTSSRYRAYLEVKPEVAKEVWSKEYTMLNAPGNEALLNYYTAWKDQLQEWNEELDGVSLNYDMIPSVRTSLVERAVKGEFFDKDVLTDWASRGWVVKEDEDDTSGGNTVNKIPLPFIQPLRSRKGDKSSQLVSRDLSRSMYLMGSSIYNYMEKSKIESELQFMRHQLVTEKLSGRQLKQKRAVKGKLAYGSIEKTAAGTFRDEKIDPETVQLYDQLFNYYMYGHSYSSDDMFIGNISAQKMISKMNSIFSLMKISLPVRLGISTKIAGSLFTHVEGRGGVHYSGEDLNKSIKMFASSDRRAYYAVTDYLNLHTEGHTYHRARRMQSSTLSQALDTSFLYEPLGLTDRSIDRNVAVAMMHSHGVSEDGEIKRLAQLPEGTKPLIEVLKEGIVTNEKGDMRVGIGTLSDEAFTTFRQKVKRIVSGIKGEQGSDNIVAAHTEMAFRLFGTFKWWMPGYLHKRFKGRYFDYIEDAPVEGRFGGLARGMSQRENFDEGETIMTWVGNNLKTAKNLMSHLVLFQGYNISNKRKARLEAKGKWSASDQKKYDAQRASIQLELDYLKKNTNDPDFKNLDLESYIEMREASVRSGLREVQIAIALTLLGSLFAMRGFGPDDDETLAQQNHALRMFSEVLAKVQLEVTFALNPNELIKLNKSAIPSLGIVEDALRLVSVIHRQATTDKLDGRMKSAGRELAETVGLGYNQFYTFVTGDK